MTKRTPAAIRTLEGNPGKRPIPKTLNVPAVMPDMPDYLDEYAREEWQRLAPGLFTLGVLRDVDQAAFAAYCDCYSKWRAATERLNALRAQCGADAFLIYTTNGNVIQNPLLGIANTAGDRMFKFASEFGLTPLARERISAKTDDSTDEFKGLIGVVGRTN